MDPFPEEHDLLALFECKPTLADAKIPWSYNHLTFETRRDGDQFTCEIEPGDETLKLRWSRDTMSSCFIGSELGVGIGDRAQAGLGGTCSALPGSTRSAPSGAAQADCLLIMGDGCGTGVACAEHWTANYGVQLPVRPSRSLRGHVPGQPAGR